MTLLCVRKKGCASNMFPIIKQKTCKFLSYRPIHCRLVAECAEISNLRLVEDICKILEFMDTEVDIETRYCCSL